MHDTDLLEARRISAKHADLLGAERGCVADLLLSIGDFEARGLHRALGYATIFDYLHRSLGMSRGMAHYRMVGARLVRRFPEVEPPLRDGRLCLTTVVELSRVMKEENRAAVLPRFFGLSREEAREVAVEIEPAAVVPRRALITPVAGAEVAARSVGSADDADADAPAALFGCQHPESSTVELPPAISIPEAHAVPSPARPTVDPLTATVSRLHLTVSREFLALLRKAKAGQSRVQPGATEEQVIAEALKLLLAHQEKRKACVPAKVKREVMARDQARCQWRLADGGICGATAHLEIDHVQPRARGGADTADNCRVLCKAHNFQAARAAYGDAHMDRFAPRDVAPGDAVPADVAPPAPIAREEVAAYETFANRPPHGAARPRRDVPGSRASPPRPTPPRSAPPPSACPPRARGHAGRLAVVSPPHGRSPTWTTSRGASSTGRASAF